MNNCLHRFILFLCFGVGIWVNLGLCASIREEVNTKLKQVEGKKLISYDSVDVPNSVKSEFKDKVNHYVATMYKSGFLDFAVLGKQFSDELDGHPAVDLSYLYNSSENRDEWNNYELLRNSYESSRFQIYLAKEKSRETLKKSLQKDFSEKYGSLENVNSPEGALLRNAIRAVSLPMGVAYPYAVGVEPGIKFSVYHGNFKKSEAVLKGQKVGGGTVAQIAPFWGVPEVNFGIVFEGEFYIEEAGYYVIEGGNAKIFSLSIDGLKTKEGINYHGFLSHGWHPFVFIWSKSNRKEVWPSFLVKRIGAKDYTLWPELYFRCRS